MRNRTLEGQWWLPDRPGDKIAGIVTYDGSEPLLRLLGAFVVRDETSPGSYRIETIEDVPLLLGRCEGAAVTLLDCHQRQFKGKLTGPEDWRQTFRARLMLVGVWLEQPDEEYFDRIVVGIDHLLTWSRRSGLEQQMEQAQGGWISPTSTWKQPDALKAMVGEATVTLGLGCATSERAKADRTETSLDEHADLAVTVPEPRSAQALISQWPKAFQDLLTLAMNKPCGLHDITLIRTNPPQDHTSDGEAVALPVRTVVVEVYLSPIYQAKPDDKAVDLHDALFTCSDLPFAEVVPKWFEVIDQLGPVVAMLLGQRYIERSFMENRLITSVAAAEGLHRRLLPDKTYLPATNFDVMKAGLLAAVSAEQREWLASRLWNEPSLKDRLEQLVQQLGVDVVKSFMPKPNRWARAVTQARNVLVHRFASDEPLDGAAMLVMATMTSHLITLILLQELGMTKAQLSYLTVEHGSFRWLRDEGHKHVPKLFAPPPEQVGHG